MAIAINDTVESYDIVDDAGYEAYSVDATISKIMVNTADSNQFCGQSGSHGQETGWIPYSEWSKT
jgi:hypothetical protein